MYTFFEWPDVNGDPVPRGLDAYPIYSESSSLHWSLGSDVYRHATIHSIELRGHDVVALSLLSSTRSLSDVRYATPRESCPGNELIVNKQEQKIYARMFSTSLAHSPTYRNFIHLFAPVIRLTFFGSTVSDHNDTAF